MKSLSAFTVAALIAAAPAFAQERLPVTYLVHKLTGDGIQVRAIEAERGIYEARLVATDGSIVKVGIDPQTADLTDAFSGAKARVAKGPAPKLTASEAVMAAAGTGYWDVQQIELEKGRWLVDARDDQGRSRIVAVDAETGAVN